MNIKLREKFLAGVAVGVSIMLGLTQACAVAPPITVQSPTPVPTATQSPAPVNLASVQGVIVGIGFPMISVATDQGQTIRFDVGTYTQITGNFKREHVKVQA